MNIARYVENYAEGHSAKYEFHKITELQSGAAFQRDVRTKKIREWASILDEPALFRPLEVWAEQTSKGIVFWLLDGQHRVALWNHLGRNGQPMMCRVHYGLDAGAAAGLFANLQGTPLAIMDWFKARYLAGAAKEREMEKIASTFGWHFAKVDEFHGLPHLTSIPSAYALYNVGTLEAVLGAISGAWGTETAGARSAILYAVSDVIQEGAEQGRLIRTLKKLGAEYLWRVGLASQMQKRRKRKARPGSLRGPAAAIADEIVAEYNNYLKKGRLREDAA